MLRGRTRHELKLLPVVNLQGEIPQRVRGGCGGGGGARSHDRRSRRRSGGARGRRWLKLNRGDHGGNESGDRSSYGEELRL